jgi:hypothetical protein
VADASPILHERIPPDARDDIAMRVVLDGDLPAALETGSGLVSAPDPRRPVPSSPRSPQASAGGTFDADAAGRYEPDTDTRRPDLLPYDEPFTPSTAPFKRLVAFDAVDSDFRLVVADPTLRPLAVGEARGSGGAEESFYADIVVAAPPARASRAGPLRAADLVRIPSVGPGARVVHARFGAGTRELESKLWRDGADNWFIQAGEAGRLVMEVSIPRAAFGGELGVARPGDLRLAAPTGRAPSGRWQVSSRTSGPSPTRPSPRPVTGACTSTSRSRRRACAATALTASPSPPSGWASPRGWS